MRLLLIAFDSLQKYRQEHEQESVISSNPIDDENYRKALEEGTMTDGQNPVAMLQIFSAELLL